jgi:hypothetical protein
MAYFDDLRRASEFHAVVVRGDRAFLIKPVDDTDNAWVQFQRVAADAKENEGDGYEVALHPFHRRGLPGYTGTIYDHALISRTDP